MIYIATYARKLKDKSGNYIAPATRASCVYMSDNTTLEDFVNNLNLKVINMYPTGSIYQSTVEESPASLFGGEWEKLENTFLYGSGTKTLGDTGGEETHKLTIAEMPSHRHREQGYFACGDGGKAVMTTEILSSDAPRQSSILNEGGDQPHNNMPPYTVINIWKRVA